MSVRKTNGDTYVTSYRMGKADKAVIAKVHGGLAPFLNKAVAAEVARIKGDKKPKTKLAKVVADARAARVKADTKKSVIKADAKKGKVAKKSAKQPKTKKVAKKKK